MDVKEHVDTIFSISMRVISRALGKKRKRHIPSVVAPFWLIQLAHNAAIEATLKDLLLQMHVASIASSDSVLSVSLSTSQVEVRSTIGWQIIVHAVGTSVLSSSSASTGPIMIVEKATRLAIEKRILIT